ncbi:hypothetical protein RHSIM_Rhsim09G0175500 [Rhododendron simsii]|uniref:non-specific serine/threonine protein kinase n=1 Tax=Rhododendron simsii TaxID=118357 RepID=A0A834GDT9_RHOSS|nr:hypothetical protein RHSIM_Rhsim09G0175500 [Rhododendron simsii]
MTAHVGYFGLARFLTMDNSYIGGEESNSLAIKGSIGYVAPDSRMLFEESNEAKNDVDQNEKIGQAKLRECLMSLMRIGVACSAGSLGERINVMDALVGLMTIKEVFVGVASFGSLSKLTDLDLTSNHLIGGIPPSLGNLSLLQSVSFARNSLTGNIPHSIGHLRNLDRFGVGSNKLSGSLPQDIGLRLLNLIFVSIAVNQFWGPIPASLSNASRMEYLSLSDNNFSGGVPFDLGRKMKNLYYLNLGRNNLGSGDARDLSFIDSFTNCSMLQSFNFYANGFGGVLPTSIANLSSLLNRLVAGRNQLVGSIPAGISNFVNLDMLALEGNFLSGVIPFEIGKLRNLQGLDFSRNKLSGPIPESIGNLTRIFEIYLDQNNLNGTIPSSIENILGLQTLNLSHNFLTGPIPKSIGLFSTLAFMNLENNSFMGALPLEIGKLNNLQELDVSENKLSGHIPSTLGNCLKLEGLFLEGNTFQDSIPPSLSSLRGIQVLDLSRNNLSGQIPKDLAALVLLKNLNLSFNNLAGEVPLQGVFGNLSTISLVGNKGLCGGIAEMQLPACPKSIKKENRLGFKIIVPIACIIPCLTLYEFCFLTYLNAEYGIGGRTSAEGDIYSYGILLLEMLTGKRPTDELFTSRQSLHEFCKVALPERVMDIVDPHMLLEVPTEGENDAQNERNAKIRECTVSIVRIGIACSAESPGERMNIKEVIIGLMKIKEVFLGGSIHGRRKLRMRLTECDSLVKECLENSY